VEAVVDDDGVGEVPAQDIEVFDVDTRDVETGIAVEAVLDQRVGRIQQVQHLVRIVFLFRFMWEWNFGGGEDDELEVFGGLLKEPMTPRTETYVCLGWSCNFTCVCVPSRSSVSTSSWGMAGFVEEWTNVSSMSSTNVSL
jgi:hypothetical protein